MTNTDTITPDTILYCGHTPTPNSGIGTGYARHADTERTLCYACADSEQAARMSTEDRIMAYIDSAGRNVITWSGGVLARVVSHGTARSGFYGSTVHFWGALDASGHYWYGRNGGDGMSITLRRSVSR